MKIERVLITIILLAANCQIAQAGDWPQFRCDAARTGYTQEPLSSNLSLLWTYRSTHTPQPAWKGQDTRMTFDYAYHAIIAQGLVFFASSADNKLYALDAATGRQEWIYFGDSPFRFAPVFSQGHLYASCDDGHLYCIRAKTGELIWKKRAGPTGDMVLGNGRMISRWPARGAPTILDDTIYYCAGIWPSEGIYLYALELKTGKELWLNDSSGNLLMDQPHPGAQAMSGISAQGYLAASGDTLLVPTGRAIQAAFDRHDGTFRYFHLQKYGRTPPGSFITIVNGLIFSRNELFNLKSGELLTKGISDLAIAAFPKHMVFARGYTIVGIDRSELLEEQQRENSNEKHSKKIFLRAPSWSITCPEPVGVSLIGAGQTIVVGTKNHKIITADIQSKSVVTVADVDGIPMGLSAADGYLIVSTDRGTIHCFREKTKSSAIEIRRKLKLPPHDKNRLYATAAKEIVNRTGKAKGYCLDIGCDEGHLAYELAKRTDLYIYAVESDPAKVTKARNLLDAAGLYGTRVTVLQRDLTATDLPDYFANLIVSGTSVKMGADSISKKEITRLLRPYGGTVCLGKPGRMHVNVQDALKGAGNWTHQYCDPTNSNCSTDELVKAPLRMLWYIDNSLEMPSRHGRGPAPLCQNGQLFVEGLHGLRALDAYNGHVMWTFPLKNVLKAYDQEHLMGTSGTGSNFCLTAEGLYLRMGSKCLKLDPTTGKLLGEFEAPMHPEGKENVWGYISCINHTLFGTLANTEHIVAYCYGRSDMQNQLTESVLLFALDVNTGKLKWSYKPQHSIRNNSIAMGNGKVYLIDRPLALCDRLNNANRRQEGEKMAIPATQSQPSGILVALDINDGNVIWRSSDNIYGTMLAISEKHDILLMAYQDTRFKLVSEFGGRMAAFCASDGKRHWDIEAQYRSRLILNDQTIYAEPGAWDLLTGERKEFDLKRSYGCGILSGSRYLLTFRSATLGYRDLLSNKETENYGGIRPGCWINTIPACGLLLVPEASNRCVCSYLIKATIALQPIGR